MASVVPEATVSELGISQPIKWVRSGVLHPVGGKGRRELVRGGVRARDGYRQSAFQGSRAGLLTSLHQFLRTSDLIKAPDKGKRGSFIPPFSFL